MRLPTRLNLAAPPASLRRAKLVGALFFLLLGGCPASPATAPSAPAPSVVPAPPPTPAPAPTPVVDPAPVPSPAPVVTAPAANGGAVPNKPLRNCEEVRASYKTLLTTPEHTRCSADADCQTVSGECGLGLGGCYHAVNHSVAQEAVSALGTRYQELSCTGPVCRCARPPAAHCTQGVCALP
jgi:hypothetical protein